jgi:hypothetical protein
MTAAVVTALYQLAQAASVIDPTSTLTQYGALGVMVGLLGLAVRVLFAREAKAHDLERARADRLEGELRALNSAIQERYMTTLAEATHAISEALAVTRRKNS